MNNMKFDVCILGGGLAGQLLARQLRRSLPHLSVGVFEQNSSSTYKVGESTVEIASNYLIRRLGLSSYLHTRQLPKNGLRFFFDSAEKNTPLQGMSEIGGISFPFHPAFQVDRASFEADLQRMNQEDCVNLFFRAKVAKVSLANSGSGGTAHRVEILSDTGLKECSCRWLVDATGRSSVVARNQNLRLPETGHLVAAAWGRFERVADWDDFGPREFRERVRYSSRMLSTNHLCYPGYWIWFIPLGKGITSIGVVMERDAAPNRKIGTSEGFLAFLKQHQAVVDLLKDTTLTRMGSLGQLAYKTRRFFSGSRWGLIGEAAAFTDPLYSPGSDFIALENDFLTNLIRLDHEGCPQDELAILADLYDDYMHFRFEATMRLYRNLYSSLGSFEVFKIKWTLDFALYYHWWLSEYLQDLHLNEAFLRERLADSHLVLNTLSKFADFFRTISDHLRSRGWYYRHNRGSFMNSFDGIDFVEQVGLPRDSRYQLNKFCDILNRTRGLGLESLRDLPSDAIDPVSLPDFLRDQPIV